MKCALDRVLCQDESGPIAAFKEHSSHLPEVGEKRTSRREPSQGHGGRVDMQSKENRNQKVLSITYTQSAVIFKYMSFVLRVNMY